jgi:hypothetical protein
MACVPLEPHVTYQASSTTSKLIHVLFNDASPWIYSFLNGAAKSNCYKFPNAYFKFHLSGPIITISLWISNGLVFKIERFGV